MLREPFPIGRVVVTKSHIVLSSGRIRRFPRFCELPSGSWRGIRADLRGGHDSPLEPTIHNLHSNQSSHRNTAPAHAPRLREIRQLNAASSVKTEVLRRSRRASPLSDS